MSIFLLLHGIAGLLLDKVKSIRMFFAPKKFILLRDLGIITVPSDYEHYCALDSFRKRNPEMFKCFDERLTDANFQNPSYVLHAGDKLWVRVYRQVGLHATTTTKERMEFLEREGAIYTGAQGAMIVFEQKRDLLPKGYWYSSMDVRERLFIEEHEHVYMPELSAGDNFCFFVGYFNLPCLHYMAFMCFSKARAFKPPHRGRLLGT
jgi:hypothetical protein